MFWNLSEGVLYLPSPHLIPPVCIYAQNLLHFKKLKCIFLISYHSLVHLEIKCRIDWRFQSNHLSNVRAFAIVIFLWLWIKCKVKLHLHVFFSFSPSVPSIIILNIFGFFCVDMQLEGSLASANPWKSPLAFPSSKLN